MTSLIALSCLAVKVYDLLSDHLSDWLQQELLQQQYGAVRQKARFYQSQILMQPAAVWHG